MEIEVRKYLEDIRQAVELIGQFTQEKSLNDYQNNAMLRSAVERQFEIVGEALNRMAKLQPTLLGKIIDAPRIVAFRNILIHGYDVVDDLVVWDVVQKNLPRLQADVARLLSFADD